MSRHSEQFLAHSGEEFAGDARAGAPDVDKWARVRSALLKRFGRDAYVSWFEGLAFQGEHDGCVVIEAPSMFEASLVGQRYQQEIKEIWRAENGPVQRITIRPAQVFRSVRRTAPQAAPAPVAAPFAPAAPAPAPAPSTPRQDCGTPLDERRSFDSYAVSARNLYAHGAARRFSEGTGEPLLYLHGSSGHGKTHLLNAIGLAVRAAQPALRVGYLTYDDFLSEFVDSCRANAAHEFRQAIRAYDVLLIDDVHMLRGRKGTQEVLHCLIDESMARGKRVAIAGSSAPAVLAESGLLDRLASRLEGGLCVEVPPADYALRFEILRVKAAALGCDLAPDVLDFVARSFDDNVRELEGALSRIALYHAEDGGVLGIARVKEILADQARRRPRVVTIERIKEAVSEVFAISMKDIMSRRRLKPMVRARHAIAYAAKKLTDESYLQLGAALGRDHSTIVSGVKRAEDLILADKAYAEKIRVLLERLKD